MVTMTTKSHTITFSSVGEMYPQETRLTGSSLGDL